jgi:cold shock CspA family protein
MRSKGRIVAWHDEKGYGFVAPFSDGPQVFLHIKAIQNRDRRPVVDDVVTYTLTVDDKGRPQARDAKLAGVAPRPRTNDRPGRHAAPLAVSFLAAVGASSLAMLHALAFAGGWPGALVARHTMRHKTIKQPFRTMFWATVLLNCLLLTWLHKEEGRVYLDSLL